MSYFGGHLFCKFAENNLQMPSYNYYLKDNKAQSETPIYIRFNHDELNMKFYIGKKITPKYWNPETQEARRALAGYSDFNTMLSQHLSALKTLVSQMEILDGKISAEKLRIKFDELLEKRKPEKKKEQTNYLTDYIESYMEQVRNLKAANTLRQYKESLKILRAYEAKERKKLTFDDIDLVFYRKYVAFMKQHPYSINWIGKNIKNIKLFMGEAHDEKLHNNTYYQHKKFASMSEEVDAIYLTEQEIQKLFDHNLSASPKHENARDLFVIGCWTGLRYSDLSQLTSLSRVKENFKTLTLKTGEKVVIPIHPLVYSILDRYADTRTGLPRIIASQNMNEYIKQVGETVKLNDVVVVTKKRGKEILTESFKKWELITTHTCRRSFATNLWKMGYPPIAIMLITGHKTESAFMRYIKVSKEENAEMLRKFWDKKYSLVTDLMLESN
jgi:site-specific recombinase XerD